jgi:hypothetical protein
LALNLSKGKWHCWTCDSGGYTLLSLFRKLNVSKEQIRELQTILHDEISYVQHDTPSVEIRLPDDYQPMWIPTKELEYKHAVKYLRSRNITKYDIMRYRIGYCNTGPYANRIIIPSYDDAGKLNYFVGRDFFGNSTLKYKNPPISKNIIGFDYHINWNYPIVLCEGVMDAIAIKWNAIPLLGKTLQNKLQQKIVEKQVSEIYIALDSDAANAAMRLCETLLKDGQTVYMVNLTGKDPSEIGFAGMRKLIEESKEVTFKDRLSMKLSKVNA